MSIPTQTEVLVDGIVAFESAVTETAIQSIANTATFKVKLDFEDAYTTQYVVTLSEDKKFIFDGDYERDGLLVSADIPFTFIQSDGSVGEPILFSTEGTFPVPAEDTLNMSYYLNGVYIGDPNKYVQEFSTSTNNKVVVRPSASTTRMYYHTTSTDKATTTRGLC